MKAVHESRGQEDGLGRADCCRMDCFQLACAVDRRIKQGYDPVTKFPFGYRTCLILKPHRVSLNSIIPIYLGSRPPRHPFSSPAFKSNPAFTLSRYINPFPSLSLGASEPGTSSLPYPFPPGPPFL